MDKKNEDEDQKSRVKKKKDGENEREKSRPTNMMWYDEDDERRVTTGAVRNDVEE
jgi:hypothetical protein